VNQKILSRLSAVCACGLAVLAAGCSPEWIAGEAPDTPPGAFKPDPVVPENKAAMTSADYSDAQFASLPPSSSPADKSYDLAGFTLKDAPGTPAPAEKSQGATLSAPTASPVQSKTGDSVPAPASDSKDIKYVVQTNDTLSGIAYIYGVPVDELAAHNGLTAKSTIKPRQVLYIPTDKISGNGTQSVDQIKAGFQPLDNSAAKTTSPAVSAETTEKAAAAAAAGAVTYTVVAGDTLGKIGQKFHVNYMKIAKANNMDPNAKLYVGKKLVIPEAKAAPDTAKSAAPKKKAAGKSTAPKAADKTPAVPKADAAAGEKSADNASAAEPAGEQKAKSDDAADSDIFGDEPATSADAASAPAAASAAPEAAPAAAAKAEPEVQQGPADPPDIFQYNLTSESTLKSICNSMHYKEETVLKLNPGISINERLGAGRSITLPMIPDDL